MSEDKKIVCPNGHSDRFQKMPGVMVTAMGWGPDIVDNTGRIIEKAVDPNIRTYTYRCLDCKEYFEVRYQYGKIYNE